MKSSIILLKIIFLIFILNLSLYSGDYILYPKMESGNNLSEVYQSTFFIPKYGLFTISPFVLSDFNGGFEHGLITVFQFMPHSAFSLSYAEKSVDQVFKLPFTDFHYPHKESAFNLSYQQKISIINIQIGGNLSDPIHLKLYEFNGQVLPSMNVGMQIEPSQYILIEGGITNIFKESSRLVQDNSENFFTSTSIMLTDDICIKLSLHKFRNKRINSNLLTRYYFTEDIFMGFNVSTNPSVISFGGGINNSIGFFKIFGGLKKKKSFFAFLSYTLFYSHDKKHSKSIINNKLPSTQKQVVHDLVNINTADESKLITLPNIGLKTAKKVIKYREENGLFYECDELMEVSGIGIKKYEKLKRLITVGNVDINKSLSNIRRWTMKEFTDIGFSPSLSLRLVLFIQDRERFNSIEDLLKVNGFDKYKLILLKKTLKNYEQKRKNH